MTLEELLDRLIVFEPTGFPFISLYLDARADERGRVNFDSFVRKELSERAKTYPAGSAERESFERDAERITDYLEKEREPSANGLAVFACQAADGFFEAAQLGAPLERNRVFVYQQPHLYPLVKLMDQYPRYAVLLASTNQARIFVFGRGRTLDSDTIQGRKTNRTKVGGWSQMRYQRHLANYHLHHAKEVIETLERVVREDRAQHLILAGDDVIMPILREQMPPHLTELVVETMRLDINTPEHEILTSTLGLLREHDAQTDADKVSRLFDEYRAGGLGTAGVPNTVVALANGQVEELLITARPSQIEYSETKLERVIAAYESALGTGELDTGQARVVADELLRQALESSARVSFIEDPTLLAEVGGVGALLRYPMSVQYSDNAQRLVAAPGASPPSAAGEDAPAERLSSAASGTEVRTAPDNSDVKIEATKNAIIETRVFRDPEAAVDRVEVKTPAQGLPAVKLFLRNGEIRELMPAEGTDVLEVENDELARIADYSVVRRSSPVPPEREADRAADAVAPGAAHTPAGPADPERNRSRGGENESGVIAGGGPFDAGAGARATPPVVMKNQEELPPPDSAQNGGVIASLQRMGLKVEEEVNALVDRVKEMIVGPKTPGR